MSRAYRDPAETDVFGRESGEVSRTQFDDVNDYHTHSEAAGQQRDVTGTLYPAEQQGFVRRVSITAATQAILSRTYTGVLVTVTVEEPQGKTWQLTRFVPEPLR